MINKNTLDILQQSVLGKKSDYATSYNPNLLFLLSRTDKRHELEIDEANLPFYGFDLWNHYEVSWLNNKGKPVVAIVQIIYDCQSPYLVESKSLKLYFNSFNQSRFNSLIDVEKIIKQDLEARLQTQVIVKIHPLPQIKINHSVNQFNGFCLDEQDIECSVYQVEPAYLTTDPIQVEEVLYSDLLKSNCLVTGQPDWGSVQIAYRGQRINYEGLLKYIVSFREHNEFHEQCIERIFTDIMKRCQPESLTVYGRYTRRGGLDINPLRSTEKNWSKKTENIRLIRQ